MPELPEMETYRRLLGETVLHAPISQVHVLREKTVNVPANAFQQRLTGRTITSIRRRAKHLLFDLDSTDVLVLHLMLGGWMYFGGPGDTPPHQSQVILDFAEGRQLFFQGLRLGYLHIYARQEADRSMESLGPEPLDPAFTAQTLRSCVGRKRGPVKFALVDQHALSGVGNCYSDEACFEGGILPLRQVPTITDDEWLHLHEGLIRVLRRAIQLGGYMEYPYRSGDTLTGGYNDHCLVYDRGDAPCLRCGTPISQTRHNKRKVFYCSRCQR